MSLKTAVSFINLCVLCKIINNGNQISSNLTTRVCSLTSTAASVASASVPSAALVLMMIVLTAIEAPVQDVSLLWAVDWFV